MKRKVSFITKDLIKLEEKRKIIVGLHHEQLECLNQIVVLLSKGSSVYPKVTQNRTFRMIGWGIKAKQIQAQIDVVKATPILKQGGLSVVGGNELIISQRLKK